MQGKVSVTFEASLAEDDFFKLTRLDRCTHIYDRRPFSKKEIDGFSTTVIIGEDYKGFLKLPPGTEAIKIFDLIDGSQEVHYLHENAHLPGGKDRFLTESRTGDYRITLADLGLVPTYTLSDNQNSQVKIDFNRLSKN